MPSVDDNHFSQAHRKLERRSTSLAIALRPPHQGRHPPRPLIAPVRIKPARVGIRAQAAISDAGEAEFRQTQPRQHRQIAEKMISARAWLECREGERVGLKKGVAHVAADFKGRLTDSGADPRRNACWIVPHCRNGRCQHPICQSTPAGVGRTDHGLIIGRKHDRQTVRSEDRQDSPGLARNDRVCLGRLVERDGIGIDNTHAMDLSQPQRLHRQHVRLAQKRTIRGHRNGIIADVIAEIERIERRLRITEPASHCRDRPHACRPMPLRANE